MLSEKKKSKKNEKDSKRRVIYTHKKNTERESETALLNETERKDIGIGNRRPLAPKADLLDKLEPSSCSCLFTKEETSSERGEEKERIKSFERENKVFLIARVVSVCPWKMTSYFRSLAFGLHGYSQYTKDGFAGNIKDADIDCLKRDLTNISVLITGANGGIGFATAVALAKRNATVHLLCRSMQRGEKAVKEILDAVARERGGGGGGRPVPQCNLHLHVCDVGSNVEVRAFVEEFTRSGHQLHVLVNNAATLSTSEAIERSVDGYETSFAVNTLGTHLLTSSLRPVLGRTSESQRNSSVSGRNGGYFGSMSTNGGGGDGGSPGSILLDGESGKLNALTYVPRVITVSSAGMLAEELVIDDLEYTKPKKYSGVSQYARDKRRQVALTERWARLEAEKKLPGSWSPEKEVAKSKKDTRKEVNNDNRSNSSSKKGDAVKRVPDIVYVSMHPGWVDTPGLRSSLPGFYNSMKGKLRTPEQGADTIVYLICLEAAKLEPGAFYFDRKPTAKHIKMGFTQYSEKDVEKLAKKLDAMACEASVHGSFRNGRNFHQTHAAGEWRPKKSSDSRSKNSDGVGIAGGGTRNGVGADGEDTSNNENKNKNNKITNQLFCPRSIGDDFEGLDGDDSIENEVFTPRKWHGFNIR